MSDTQPEANREQRCCKVEGRRAQPRRCSDGTLRQKGDSRHQSKASPAPPRTRVLFQKINGESVAWALVYGRRREEGVCDRSSEVAAKMVCVTVALRLRGNKCPPHVSPYPHPIMYVRRRRFRLPFSAEISFGIAPPLVLLI